MVDPSVAGNRSNSGTQVGVFAQGVAARTEQGGMSSSSIETFV